jgi:hypothetical protein
MFLLSQQINHHITGKNKAALAALFFSVKKTVVLEIIFC